MNTQFERSAKPTDEWYTPKEIIDALGKFDLDPCAPVVKGVDPNPTPDDFAYMVVRNADAIIKKLKGE